MEVLTKKRLILVAGRGHSELSDEVAAHLKVPLGECVLSTFANGEIYCRYGENIRSADVFVFQTHGGSINDLLMEQLIMIDAAKRASAKRITAVCPFYGYARQDRKAEGREPITARLVADMLTAAGADRVVTVDLHTGQIQGFFDFPVDHLTAVPVIAQYLAQNVEGDAVIVAPDAGGGKLARRFADRLGADIAFIDKRRPKGTHNVAVATEVVGDIEGRTCIIVDDMIDTAGTVVSAANLLIDRGAVEVYIAATHGLLSGPAVDRLKNGPIREVVVTNTVPISDEKRFDTLRVLSIAPLLAEAIDAVFEDGSVSELFGGDNMQMRVFVAVIAGVLFVSACGGSSKPEVSKTAVTWPAPSDPMTLARDAGLVPETAERLQYHVHAHLDVFVDGAPVVVPAGIGIDITNPGVKTFGTGAETAYGGIDPPCDEPCISPLHTHDVSGTLHTESATKKNNTLGQFFTEWGVKLDENCVETYCKPDTDIAFYIEGEKASGDPRKISLSNGREIAVVIGTPPEKIPDSWDQSA